MRKSKRGGFNGHVAASKFAPRRGPAGPGGPGGPGGRRSGEEEAWQNYKGPRLSRYEFGQKYRSGAFLQKEPAPAPSPAPNKQSWFSYFFPSKKVSEPFASPAPTSNNYSVTSSAVQPTVATPSSSFYSAAPPPSTPSYFAAPPPSAPSYSVLPPPSAPSYSVLPPPSAPSYSALPPPSAPSYSALPPPSAPPMPEEQVKSFIGGIRKRKCKKTKRHKRRKTRNTKCRRRLSH